MDKSKVFRPTFVTFRNLLVCKVIGRKLDALVHMRIVDRIAQSVFPEHQIHKDGVDFFFFYIHLN